MTSPDIRVLIVTEHASFRFGGEAILPAHYFKGLRQRGVDCRLITHARTRPELQAAFPTDQDRITYLPDTFLVRTLYRMSKPLPDRLSYFTFGWLIRILNQLKARKLARRLIAQHHIDVVHQPIPVSPKEPTLLRKLGAPLVIGPMNGGMYYPADFKHYDSALVRLFSRAAAALVPLLHRLLPGKRQAALLLVANDRTRAALPTNNAKIENLVENGVDLQLWQPKPHTEPPSPAPTRFLFAGRLIRLKGVDLLLEAARKVRDQGHPIHLEIVGDGPLRADLEQQAATLNLTEIVHFAGWITQSELAARMRTAADVFILPSLHECGGAVVLEAMATALPTIAIDWGGPADYLDAQAGILVPPTPREKLIASLAAAMTNLAINPARRRALGEAARRKVEREYDWNHKIDQILALYAKALARE